MSQYGYVTDLLSDAVIAFIDSEPDKPFFVYMSQAAVHVPMQGPDDAPLRTANYYAYKADHKFSTVEYMRRYSEMLTSMDQGVKRITEALEKHEIDDRTLIIFVSDNGGTAEGALHGRVNGDLRGFKGTMYEGGIKVPAFFYWKGGLAPRVLDGDVGLTMDLFPTILEFAGIEYEGVERLDGVSLVPALRNGERMQPRDLFWMHTHRLAMRRGGMKLVRSTRQPELYDLIVDPREMIDLAGEPAYAGYLQDMVRASDRWKQITAEGQLGEREIGVARPVQGCQRDWRGHRS
jgi:arylsulfatase A-like enzyme